MADPLGLYLLVGISVVLSAAAAAGVWLTPRVSLLSEEKLEQLLDAMKGNLVAELARARTAVEAGLRDSGEAYAEAQQVLSGQVDVAVDRMREELLRANLESLQLVQNALEEVFYRARLAQERNLDDQTVLLKDLKANYERAIADLRAAVSQASARQNEGLNQMTERLREPFLSMAQELQRLSTQIDHLQNRLEAVVQLLESRVLERV